VLSSVIILFLGYCTVTNMPLVKLRDKPSQWSDIRDAAQIHQLASANPDIDALRNQLAAHYVNSLPPVVTDLHTGINVGRSAVLVLRGEQLPSHFNGRIRTSLLRTHGRMPKVRTGGTYHMLCTLKAIECIASFATCGMGCERHYLTRFQKRYKAFCRGTLFQSS
jgi:hypothetical protein